MRILVTGAWAGFNDCREIIKEDGHEVRFFQWEKEPLPCDPDWPEAIIGNGIFLYHSIEKFKNLQYIQVTSAGYDRVPMDYVNAHNIKIHNAKGVYSIPMSEYVLGGVLQLYKQFPLFLKNQNNHKWEKKENLLELYGKTVCIVGCGNVGTECAKRFKIFGCKVLGIDFNPCNRAFYDEIEDPAKIDLLMKQADIIVLTVPLLEHTINLIDKNRMNSLKEYTILVNISRGQVMDYQAFIEIAPEKHLAGIFDVFPEEPLSETSLLWEMDNVIITPHNSFQGNGNTNRLNEVILKNLEQGIS